MDLLTDFSCKLDIDDILRGEGSDPDQIRIRRPGLITSANTALELGVPFLKPMAVLRTLEICEHIHERIILEEANTISGTLVCSQLARATRVTAAICSIGPELETFTSQQTNLGLALALDGLGNAAVGSLGQQVCARIAERAQVDGLRTSAPISPGDEGWPVELGQRQIFSLLDSSSIGVKLTDGWMMIPQKTISFIVGHGETFEQTDLCSMCSVKESCRYRHAR
jgi:hypothetical protein